jgi:hypothetical protein
MYIYICIIKQTTEAVTTGSESYQNRRKWFLPASRSSRTPPGPLEKKLNTDFIEPDIL